ncbi:MAG: hypothetical protein K2H02_06445, partial [Anaeroplasmataceae bacterium]|nr:hypothetical protein [Anaeroplasmataceae bacterium]
DVYNIQICISEEQVVLSKFQPLDHDSQIVEAFCDSLKDTYHSDIIITDSHQILYNTLSSDLNGALLADDFLKRVNAYLDKEISSLNRIVLAEGYTIDKDALIYEIRLDSELYGYLLVLDGMIGKKQRDLADFVLKYLNKVL